MNNTIHISHHFSILKMLLISMLPCILLTSCFTGIESTKKISLSREDKKALEPTPEELFFPGIEGEILEIWEPGKEFLATDDKAILIFNREAIPSGMTEEPLGGKILKYNGVSSKMDVGGTIVTEIMFNDGPRIYYYNTGKTFDDAIKHITSDQIPMMIDLVLIKKTKDKLLGQKLWTRSPLWYDEKGERIDGQRFVPITIIDVTPGDIIFPIRLQIEDKDGHNAWMFMNYGNSGTESRSFHNLFYLEDPKRNFPKIDDDIWQLICRGKIRQGMTKEECKLSLGNPKTVNSGHDYSQTLDIWSYENGAVLWFEDGVLTRFRN